MSSVLWLAMVASVVVITGSAIKMVTLPSGDPKMRIMVIVFAASTVTGVLTGIGTSLDDPYIQAIMLLVALAIAFSVTMKVRDLAVRLGIN